MAWKSAVGVEKRIALHGTAWWRDGNEKGAGGMTAERPLAKGPLEAKDRAHKIGREPTTMPVPETRSCPSCTAPPLLKLLCCWQKAGKPGATRMYCPDFSSPAIPFWPSSSTYVSTTIAS